MDLGWFAPRGALAACARERDRWCSRRSRRSSSSARFDAPTSCSAWAEGREVQPVEPRVVREGETRRLVLPASRATRRAAHRRRDRPDRDIGRALLHALEADPAVGRVLGMARRPFDPAELGLRKTEYRQGDVLDRESSRALVEDADVLVHLAFIISAGATRRARSTCRARATCSRWPRAGPRRVDTSSVAAYGFHDDNPRR